MCSLHKNVFERAEKLLAQAFPEGLSTEDRTAFQSLAADTAEIVVRRLSVVLEAERPNSRRSTELAAEAGISIRLFYDLKRRWKQDRRLATLIPYQQVKRAGPYNQGEGLQIARLAHELIEATPDHVAAGIIARKITRKVEGPNAFRSALRHVRLARLKLSKDIEYLKPNYGQTILCDVTSIRIPAFGKRDAIVPGAAFVIERASRLILSAVVVSSSGALKAQLEGAEAALQFLSGRCLDRPLDELQHIETEFILSDGRPAQLEHIRDQLRQHSEINVIDTGSRRFGQSLVSLLGSQLGKINFAPRFTAEQLHNHPALEDSALAAHAQSLLDLELQHHNSPILDVLDSGKSNKLGLVRDGTMAARLKLIAEALRDC